MGHSHEHNDSKLTRTGRLKFALGLTFLYMLVEAIGGWLTNSLALIADAGHMLTDVAALTLTIGSIWFAGRPATAKKTFGYFRLEILAAFVNGIALVLLSIWVIYEAYERWQTPPAINGTRLTVIAIGGLIVNIIAAKLLHHGHQHDLNMRGAWLHVMGDLLGSATAIVAGILIAAFGWLWADPMCSVLISLIIIFGAWRLIMDSVNVLLEGTPTHIDLAAVENTILETEGVAGVHDLHVWTISSGMEALSAHISHNATVEHTDLLGKVRERLHTAFGIDHLTIQMETIGREDETVYMCETGSRCFVPAKQH
ncbi:MAG: cation diffusion facilitator family transporter [Pyrinomonadaceae bacterium]